MRIVSLLPAATDIVASLGALDALVGRTHECDWPPGALDAVPVVTRTNLPTGLSSREISAALAGDGHHGSSIYELDEAALAQAAPDVVLTQDLCDVCAVSYRTVNDAVRMMSLDTTVVSLEPRTIEGILESIRAVGDLIGARERADEVCARAYERLSRMPGPGPDSLSVLFVEWLDPLMPGGHWVPEQIAYAGGRSLLLAPGQHSVPHHFADVITARPDVIVLGPCGLAPSQTRTELPILSVQPGWEDLPAVREGNVWVVDGTQYFNRPGPRVVDGVEILAAILASVNGGGAVRDDVVNKRAWRVTDRLS